MEGRTFELPDDIETVVRIINSVPLVHCWVQGHLSASDKMLETGNIAKAGYLLNRSKHPIRVIPDVCDRGLLVLADYLPLIVGEKGPGFVWFDNVPGRGELYSEDVRTIVLTYLKKGYTGDLDFLFSPPRGSRVVNGFQIVSGFLAARCRFRLGGQESSTLSLIDVLPCQGSGSKEFLESVLRECQAFDLQELAPTA